MVEITSVSSAAAARQLTGEWNRLAEASSAQPTMLPEYTLSWWDHCGTGSLQLLVARRDERVVSIAPLHQRSIAGMSFCRWLGHGTGAVGHPISDPDDPIAHGAMWEAIVRRSHAFDLTEIPVGELKHIRTHHTRFAEDRCPTAALEPGWSLDDYLAGGKRKRARREISRTMRRLEQGHGEFNLVSASTTAELDALMPDLLAVYDASEAERTRLHLLRGDLAPFFNEFLTGAADQGRLDVFVGYVNGSPAAFDVLVTVGSASHTILGRYHPEARDWGVGHLLMRAMAERALERSSSLLNLQIGDDEYKRAWTDGGEDVVHVLGSRLGNAGTEAMRLRYRGFDVFRDEVQPRLGQLLSR